MSWRYNFTFKMTNSGRKLIHNWLVSKGYKILEQSSDYIIIDGQVTNTDKLDFRTSILSLLISEREEV